MECFFNMEYRISISPYGLLDILDEHLIYIAYFPDQEDVPGAITDRPYLSSVCIFCIVCRDLQHQRHGLCLFF